MRSYTRRRRRNLHACSVLASLLLLISAGPALALPTLSMSPSAPSLGLGDVFSVYINITDASNVYGWQMDVSFDSSVINILGSSEGTFLSSGGFTTFFINGTLDNGTGLVDDMAATRTGAVAGANGAGLLATLTFQGMGVGTSALTLGNVILSDPASQSLTVGLLTGTSVTVVPEPATVMLLASGFFGLAALRANRKRATG